MIRIRLRLEFDGKEHCGWQTQDPDREILVEHKTSVQSELKKAIEIALNFSSEEGITLRGCGRTDAGVSAEEFYCHFDWVPEKLAKDFEKIRHSLNGILPESIGVTEVVEVPSDFHALDSVVQKTYCYKLLIRRTKPTWERRTHYWISKTPQSIPWETLKAAAKLIEGEHDFRAFCAAHAATNTTIRKVDSVQFLTQEISRGEGLEVVFEFKARGFLRHMVRNLTGALIEIIEEKRSLESLGRLLSPSQSELTRKDAGLCAPAWALVLKKVEYRNSVTP